MRKDDQIELDPHVALPQDTLDKLNDDMYETEHYDREPGPEEYFAVTGDENDDEREPEEDHTSTEVVPLC